MISLVRRALAAVFALTLLVFASSQAIAGYPEGWERVGFELTLSGEIDPDDTFAVEHSCGSTNECVFIHVLTVLCSGDDAQPKPFGSPPCEARTYRLELKRAAGVTVEYGLARWAGAPIGEPTHLLPGSVTVPGGGITIRLGYDYSLGASPGGGVPPVLPDTAASRPADVLPLATALLVLSLALVICPYRVALPYGRPASRYGRRSEVAAPSKPPTVA